jgi:Flp pilus assembly protein TadG
MARALLRRIAGCRSGAGTIEVALTLPVIVLVLTGLFDFGSSVMNAMALQSAARAGAQYALARPDDANGIAAVVAAAARLDAASLTITTNSYCECPGRQTVACGGVCAANVQPGRFVSVEVAQPFVGILPYPSFMRPTRLRGSSVMRVG